MGKNGSSPRLSQRLSLLAAALLMAGTAMAQDASYQVDIAPQALDQALNTLAGQTGSRILFATDIAEGREVPALRANLTVEQALERLVSGSGLRVRKTGDGSYLVSQPKDDEVMELSSVTISGKAPGSITEGTGSYTTGSTSSATRLNLAPRETPQSVTVLTRQLMDDQKIENLSDAIVATPGATRLTLGPGAPAFWMRGTTINAYQIDGVRTSSTLANYLQNTAIYDRVEIVRGATGMMSVVGSPSATVNMIRKLPTYDPQLKISAETGSWDKYGTTLDVSGALNDEKTFRGRFVADYRSRGNWTDHYKQEKSVIYGIGEFDLSDSTLLTFGFSNIKDNTNAPNGSFPLKYSNGQTIKFDASDASQPSWSYYDNKLNNIFTSIEQNIGETWVAKAVFSHTDYNYNALLGSIVLLNQPDSIAAISGADRYNTSYEENTLDAYFTGPISIFNRDHEIIYGVSISSLRTDLPSYSSGYSSGTQYIYNYYNRADELAKPDTLRKTGQTDGHESLYSAYLNGRFHLGDRAALLVGGRVTDWKSSRDVERYSTGTTVKQPIRESGNFTPYAGLTYELNDTWLIYASYTSIFAPQANTVRGINDTVLAPQEGISYETGIKAIFNDGKVNTSLSFYKTDLDNYPIYLGTINGLNAYTLIDGANTKGAELELNGELTDNWHFSGGYSYNLNKDQNGQRANLNIPQQQIKTFTTYQLPGELNKLTVGGGISWNSKTSATVGNVTTGSAKFEQDSYFLANIMARYKMNSNMTASLNVENLFNKEYIPSFSSYYGIYGSPRNINMKIEYTY